LRYHAGMNTLVVFKMKIYASPMGTDPFEIAPYLPGGCQLT
jgi:hypothetical protein